jgi:hypothetical protein
VGTGAQANHRLSVLGGDYKMKRRFLNTSEQMEHILSTPVLDEDDYDFDLEVDWEEATRADDQDLAEYRKLLGE